MNKIMFTILRILDKYQDPVGSTELAKELLSYGIDLSERTVRYYLKLLDERHMTQVQGKRGRVITELGRDELNHAFVSERVNFIISKIDSLAYLTDFNLDTLKGNIILNISFFPEKKAKDALKIMAGVFSSRYVMSNRIKIAKGGERIGDIVVPEGCLGIGTICSITLNGIFLKAGIPVTSRYGGVIEIIEGKPTRFTSLISYEGSSIDPLEIFIKSRMTDVTRAVKASSGKILASFREIPIVSLNEAEALTKKMSPKGIDGIIIFGKPNQPLLDVPVGVDKVGMIVVGGLNPIAAVEESGIFTDSMAMSTLFEFSRLQSFNEAVSSFLFQ
ncbi:MAG TPA: NrpR regulatory domain-containing protein [Syntrophorhabdaceae bacterium]|nr:NrpR regulatory domain-containing protein [Syntrophorhabdaceae bacterium]